jgi:SAM-dependent methyltransferase
LNVGCGNGLFNTMAHDAGFTVEACEPDAIALADARRSAPPGVLVHAGGVFDAPFEQGADVVVMHDVLEHILDDSGAVHRIASLLRPGGRAVLSVPAMPSLFGLHDEMLGHHRRYTRTSLSAVVGAAFRVRRVRYFGMTFIPITFVFSRWRRLPYPSPSSSGGGVIDRVFGFVCGVESRLPVPIGTSLICDLTPKVFGETAGVSGS